MDAGVVRLLDPDGGRARRPDAATALHPRAPRRPRALPDGVRRAPGDAPRRSPRRPPVCTSPRSSWPRARRPAPEVARVDLAIGLDTFRPITADRRRGPPHPFRALCRATRDDCAACRPAGAGGGDRDDHRAGARVGGGHRELSGRTDLFVHGDYPFRVVDVLLTNFHLPAFHLLLLVEAFCGPDWRSPVRHRLGRGLPLPLLRRRHDGRPPRLRKARPSVPP